MAEITALYVVPDYAPMVIKFEDRLQSYQALVGGEVQALGLNNHTDLICNEYSKFNGMTPNRMLKYSDFDGTEDRGNANFDLIHGAFLIVGADNERGAWKSLTQEQIEKYYIRFQHIEIYLGHELGMVR